MNLVYEKPEDCHIGLLWCPGSKLFQDGKTWLEKKPYQVWIQRKGAEKGICRHYLEEKCIKGDEKCKFLHPNKEEVFKALGF